MLSEELNSMIDAAITDGVITDKERQLIMKRARIFGLEMASCWAEYQLYQQGNLHSLGK